MCGGIHFCRVVSRADRFSLARPFRVSGLIEKVVRSVGVSEREIEREKVSGVGYVNKESLGKCGCSVFRCCSRVESQCLSAEKYMSDMPKVVEQFHF